MCSCRIGILVSKRQCGFKEYRITLTVVVPHAVVAQRFALKLHGSIQLSRELWPAGTVAMCIIERQTRKRRRYMTAVLVAVCCINHMQ